jgi:hypothetical protein
MKSILLIIGIPFLGILFLLEIIREYQLYRYLKLKSSLLFLVSLVLILGCIIPFYIGVRYKNLEIGGSISLIFAISGLIIMTFSRILTYTKESGIRYKIIKNSKIFFPLINKEICLQIAKEKEITTPLFSKNMLFWGGIIYLIVGCLWFTLFPKASIEMRIICSLSFGGLGIGLIIYSIFLKKSN